MKKLLRLVVMLLACTFVLTACSQSDEKEEQLQAVREQAARYSFLNAGRNACNTLTEMIGYYDNASYQKAKETAKISDSLRAEYFPSVSWQGSEVLSVEQTCEIVDLLVSDYTEKDATYLICFSISDGYYLPTTKWYSATYSIKSDQITKLELICSY